MFYFDHVIKVIFKSEQRNVCKYGCKSILSVYVVGFGFLYFNKLYLNYFFSKV